MDKLNLTQTYHDNSLMYRWERCRLIGLINKVYFIFLLSIFGIAVVFVILMMIIFYESGTVHGCNNMMCDYNSVTLDWLLILYCAIILLIVPIGFLKMVYVNNGLRSTNIPTDGKNVNTWLIYHIGLLLLIVMSLGGLSNENNSAKTFHFFYTAIKCIVLIAEIIVVYNFNIESKISADRRNRSFEISNDI